MYLVGHRPLIPRDFETAAAVRTWQQALVRAGRTSQGERVFLAQDRQPALAALDTLDPRAAALVRAYWFARDGDPED